MTSAAPAPADRQALHQALHQALPANHAQYEAQVKAILTPDQFTQYAAVQQHRDEARAKRQQRLGGAPGN